MFKNVHVQNQTGLESLKSALDCVITLDVAELWLNCGWKKCLISVSLFLNLVYKVRVNEAHPTFEQSCEG